MLWNLKQYFLVLPILFNLSPYCCVLFKHLAALFIIGIYCKCRYQQSLRNRGPRRHNRRSRPVLSQWETWRGTSFTDREWSFISCRPTHWITYNLIQIGKDAFRPAHKDSHLKTCQRYLKAIFISEDVQSSSPDAFIHEDRYGELQQIVQVTAIGRTHILLRVKWLRLVLEKDRKTEILLQWGSKLVT